MVKTSKPKDPVTDAAEQAQQVMAEWQTKGLHAMASFGTRWIEQMSDIGSEMLSFLADRVKQDVDFQHKALHCNNAQDLHQLQADFVQRALEDYNAETARLTKIGNAMMQRDD
jgi:hypothetical protein